MILTYDVVSRIIVSGAYLPYYLMEESQIWYVDSSWDGGVVHTILGHFDLDIDFLSHFWVNRVLSISPILQLTFLKCVLCLTDSFGGIRHVTVTFLVSISFNFKELLL